jgi:uncharacterized protein (DUF1697 family)
MVNFLINQWRGGNNMQTYVSMVRGINVGGKKVKMDDLKELYKSLDFHDVKSYIQSGNIIFRTKNTKPSILIDIIENRIDKVLDLDVKVLIRTKKELKNIINGNPFRNEDINYLYVIFLSDIPSKKLIKDLNINFDFNKKNESDKFSISEKEIYLYLPNGYGRTRFNNNFFEKKLGISATTRNFRTVNKLFDIAESISKNNNNFRT